jgi:hypothetical protein
MAVWSGDLPEEWKSWLQQIKGFPDELVAEPHGLEIEERAVRRELRGMAVTWTVVLAVLLVLWLLAAVFGDHPRTSLHSLVRSEAVGQSFLFGLCLGTAVSLWAAAAHRFHDLGDSLVRALDLVWHRLGDTDFELDYGGGEETLKPQRRALRSAFTSLKQCAIEDEFITISRGFLESRFIQSWIRQQEFQQKHPGSLAQHK